MTGYDQCRRVQRAHEKKETEVVADADLDTIVQKLLGPAEHVSGELPLINAVSQPRVR